MKQTGKFRTEITDEDWLELGLTERGPRYPDGKTASEIKDLWHCSVTSARNRLDKLVGEGKVLKGWKEIQGTTNSATAASYVMVQEAKK